MIPHLTTDHGKNKTQSNQSPSCFIVQEIQIISSHVKQNSSDSKQNEHGDGACVIWRSEYPDIDFCSFIDPSKKKSFTILTDFFFKRRKISWNYFEMASAPKPTRWMSIVSDFFGLPLAGKCINTGAEFSFIDCKNKYI